MFDANIIVTLDHEMTKWNIILIIERQLHN